MLQKQIFIEKTGKYISISSYWIGRISLLNTKQNLKYLAPDVSFSDFGVEIRKKLSESKIISEEFFIYHFNDEAGLSLFNKNEEKKIMLSYGYKSVKAICKDAVYLTVSVIDNNLIIRPTHQDGLGTFTSVKDNVGNSVEFRYSINLSDEELGQAVMDAFKHCTSIYKKK
ncbi:contact-dependent growth inhibition system immunity protein [Exercitatus varius]|uniref:contact-dependent growth inhibition system immunity protein n=1 Tax=Exercitatus varius TaxID=67857 RepID=UPI0018A50FDD|nr:contact-dependent growth inhibition system immunity protein [Exercitatus varius]MDG2944690.1 contact-dependent growth inhibition system immunity protein [Exercitatus varius]MDG2959220.1 contact-dependent growth inhibition system immunity protein [Exercitatus varius]QOF67467.1 CdiI family contact-dependent growth inhibition immunity protein [Actinobacillus sp. GY-402]